MKGSLSKCETVRSPVRSVGVVGVGSHATVCAASIASTMVVGDRALPRQDVCQEFPGRGASPWRVGVVKGEAKATGRATVMLV